jgi:AGZA family xanthine/uracil permease-like MFS transporter
VADGARTGFANLVTGGWLLAAMFFSPLVAMIGGGVVIGATAAGSPIVRYPTLAPALIVVGSMMLRVISEIAWDDPTEAIPAFLTLIGIPFSFSIASGIAFGFISYSFAKLVSGRARECPALVYIFALLFIVQFVVTR